MKVFKNLFGNGSKINASEVVTKNAAGEVVGLDMAGMEVGRNSNGNWIRWNNGWQMCWHIQQQLPDDLLAGTHEFVWSLPKGFISNEYSFHADPGTFAADVEKIAAVYPKRHDYNTATEAKYLVRMIIRPTSAVRFYLWAIGHWKEPGT